MKTFVSWTIGAITGVCTIVYHIHFPWSIGFACVSMFAAHMISGELMIEEKKP